MGDTSNRIGFITGANANLLSTLGDILTSDGIQTIRIPLGAPGQFLGVDLTADGGVSWQSAGGGASLTFQDGLTRAVDTVTNNLVTGQAVSAVNALSSGDVLVTCEDDLEIDNNSSGASLIFQSGPDLVRLSQGSQKLEFTAAGVVNLIGSVAVNIDAGSLLNLTGSGVRVASDPGTQLILGSGANTLMSVGGNLQATIGGNTSFTANVGSNGSFIATAVGTGQINLNGANQIGLHTTGGSINIISDTGAVGIAGEVIGINSATILEIDCTTLSFFGVAGAAQGAAIPDASGGVVMDAEARTAINALLAVNRGYGLIAT
jgi:hypothetical protein